MLTEAAINQAFKAELVRQHLENVDDEAVTNLSGGDPVTFRDISISLLPDQLVKISAKTDLPNRDNVPIQLTANISVEKRRRIIFADPEFVPDGIPEAIRGLASTLTMAFATVLNRMVDLERFNLDGVLLRVNRLETKGKQLIFSGYAQVEHFPPASDRSDLSPPGSPFPAPRQTRFSSMFGVFSRGKLLLETWIRLNFCIQPNPV